MNMNVNLKNIALTLFLAVPMLASAAFAAGPGPVYTYDLVCTGNVSAFELPSYMNNKYLYEAKIVASADDAITLTLTDANSSVIWTGTTTNAATAGEYLNPASDGYYRVLWPGTTLTISDFAGGGTATVTLVAVE